jgi:hypothetical protein
MIKILLLIIFSSNHSFSYDVVDKIECYNEPTEKEVEECFSEIQDYDILQQDGRSSYNDKKYSDCLVLNVEDDQLKCEQLINKIE